MAALELARWHHSLDRRRRASDPNWVDRQAADVDQGRMPQSFYTLPAGARVLVLGIGCGVLAFRQATWDRDRELICVDRDHSVLNAARELAEELGLANMSFLSSLDELELPSGAPIDLLAFEPGVLSVEELESLLSRYPVQAVIGQYYDDMADDAVIYRLCTGLAGTFHLTNLSAGVDIVGKQSSVPDVSAIVVPRHADPRFERCMESLLAQDLARYEIILAHQISDEALAEAARRWEAAHPDTVKVLAVDAADSGAVMAAALDAATGSYLALVDAADWCEPSMFERLHGAAAPRQAEMAVSAFWRVRQEDNLRYFCPTAESGWVERPVDLIDAEPVIGRFLFSRAFLVQNRISWPKEIPDTLQPVAFHALCLAAARRLISLSEAYYNRREQRDSMTHSPEEIRAAVDALHASLLIETDWQREFAFKRLITRLYVRTYFGRRGIARKIAVVRSLVDDLSRCSFFIGLVESFRSR